MLKKFLFSTVIIILVFVSLFKFVVPPYVANEKNGIVKLPPYNVSKQLDKFYKELTIADLHADTLLWDRNILKRSSIGHIDVPRLLEANVSLQVFSVVTKTPKDLNIKSNNDKSDNITLLALAQGWPWKTISSLSERAIYQAQQLHYYSDHSDGKLILIKSKADLKKYLSLRKHNRSVVAGLLSFEGAHALEGEIKNLSKLYEAGYRMIGLTHFFDNEVGGSAHGLEKNGLTEFGREIIEEAQKRHMLIDLSHASPKLISDVIKITTQPVVVSHTGVKGTCDRSRNLTDDQIRAVANTGGLIGIGFWPIAVCGKTAKDIARAARYTKDIAGIEHIALGSDFDGAVSLPFDVTGLPLLLESLQEEGFSKREIGLFMGENIINFLIKTI